MLAVFPPRRFSSQGRRPQNGSASTVKLDYFIVRCGNRSNERGSYYLSREIEFFCLAHRTDAHTDAITTNPKPHQPSKEGQIGAVGPSDKAKLAGLIWDHSASHTMLPRGRTAPNTPTRTGLHFSRMWLQSSHVSMPGHINQRICTSQWSLIAYVCCFVPSMREFRRIPEETKC